VYETDDPAFDQRGLLLPEPLLLETLLPLLFGGDE